MDACSVLFCTPFLMHDIFEPQLKRHAEICLHDTDILRDTRDELRVLSQCDCNICLNVTDDLGKMQEGKTLYSA